jgi:hypothetical protein
VGRSPIVGRGNGDGIIGRTLGLTLGMWMVSAEIAKRRVAKADPAEML